MRFAAHVSRSLVCAVLGAVLAGAPLAAQTPTTAPAVRAPAATPAAAPTARPAQTQQNSPSADLDLIKNLLDQIQQAIRGAGQTDETLTQLRERLAPIRDGLRDKLDILDPRLAEVDSRLTELGAPPATGAPPENSTIAAERQRLTQTRADIDAAIKQTRLLTARADELASRINENRRTLFSRALFVRTPGVLDLEFWQGAGRALVAEGSGIQTLVRDWVSRAQDTGGRSGMIFAVLTLLAFGVVAYFIGRWWTKRELAGRTRFTRSVASLFIFAHHALAMPVAVIVILKVIDGNGLLPADVGQIGLGLAIAVAVASFGRAVGIALLAPGEPQRRLASCDNAEAARLSFHLTWASRALGAAIFLNLVHKATSAPLAATVTTSAGLAVVIGLLALHLLLRMIPGAAEGAAVRTALPWLRFAGWVFVITVAASLVTGFIGFAAFLAGRGVVLVAMAGAFYISVVFVDSLFSDVLTAGSDRGRRLAGMFGLSPRGLELVGTLVAALLKLMLAVLAVVPVLGPWGVFAADVFGVIEDAVFGFRIGGITISMGTLFDALALILIGFIATRGMQRWLDRRFLPRTGLDLGLQHSVSALFGYACVIAVLILALAEIGIDLQKIALIAGALSVGIGFGLQSIVSNFVSGIILLAERPIRVGDWVVVKDAEGIVRRISVRATEIETFDRASIIIPNSEFVTGTVKNLTHGDTLGRVAIKVGVAYDSDTDEAQELMIEVARTHPHVLQAPPPKTYLLNFGDRALEFELRCFVANVAYSLEVRSDVSLAILRAFRDAGIGIPTNPAEFGAKRPEPRHKSGTS